MELVFVYGTLRRGHGNHVLLEKSRLVDVGFMVINTPGLILLYSYGSRRRGISYIWGSI